MEAMKYQFFQDGQLLKKISFTGAESVTLSIGKEGADIRYSLPEISKLHAQIIYDGQTVYILDCNSTNGTFVNSRRIEAGQPIALKANDKIVLGTTGKAILAVGDAAGIATGNAARADVEKTSLLSYLASKDEISIGRSTDCDVVLPHASVSRLHARIRKVSSGRYRIVDTGSTNGTFVNGKKVSAADVTAADKIFIGRFQLSLEGKTQSIIKESAIKAAGVTKVYRNNYVALKETTFDVPSGGLIAIMGPSGCGKSTLLKVLNGDSPATTGNVYIHGLDLIANYGYLKTQIGYVPQDDIVHRELTVEQSLYYAAKLRLDGVSDAAAKEKIEQLLSELNITHIRNNRVSAISGGQRKRVSIGVELLSDPAILFLDEPTSPLDPQTIEEFMGILRKLSEKGTTVVLVTHKPDDLPHMDSVMFMAEGGYMVFFGPSNEYKKYFNVSVPAEVYSNISGEKAKEWIAKNYKGRQDFKTETSRQKKPSSRVNLLRQFSWLFSRYMKIKTNDRKNTLIMFLQVPIIAGLICMAFPVITLSIPFLMSVCAIWFGVNNAAREIVSELPIYKRERMFNVSILPYIFSKISVLGIFAAAQSVMFNLIIWMRYNGAELGWSNPVEGTVWMFFLTIGASLFGLVISSATDSTEKVMSIVPIAVIPQIMLAGVMTKILRLPSEWISYFTFSRWGTAGFAQVQDSVRVPITVVVKYPVVDTSVTPPVTSMADSTYSDTITKGAFQVLSDNFHSTYKTTFGETFSSGNTINMIWVGALSLLCFATIWYSLKRKDSI